jgi:hypothetical protein
MDLEVELEIRRGEKQSPMGVQSPGQGGSLGDQHRSVILGNLHLCIHPTVCLDSTRGRRETYFLFHRAHDLVGDSDSKEVHQLWITNGLCSHKRGNQGPGLESHSVPALDQDGEDRNMVRTKFIFLPTCVWLMALLLASLLYSSLAHSHFLLS